MHRHRIGSMITGGNLDEKFKNAKKQKERSTTISANGKITAEKKLNAPIHNSTSDMYAEPRTKYATMHTIGTTS